MKISRTCQLFFSIVPNSLAVDAMHAVRRVGPKVQGYYLHREPREDPYIVGLADSSESWV